METSINLTGYDFVVLGIFLLFIIRGIWLGLLGQVTGLLALYLGYFVASRYHDRLFPFLTEISDNPKVIFIISCVILFIGTYIIVMLLGKALSHVIQIVMSKWFDKMLGMVFGAIQAVIIVVFVHMILSSILAPESTMLRDCQTCRSVNMATDYARNLIRNEDVREALMQQNPAISPDAVRQFLEDLEPDLRQAPPSSPVQ